MLLLLSALATAQPPVYRISASTHHEAGVQHGKLAAARIKGWLATAEMQSLLQFTESTNDGKSALANLKRDNSAFSPLLAQEVHGIAEGAQLPVDHLWVATLINELEALMPAAASAHNRTGHCSDVYAVPKGGTASGFAHGHNEDWPGPVKNFWYFLSINATGGNSSGDGLLSSCAGMCYPGGLVGWASTWNAKGVFLTQNSLFPAHSRSYGLASAFAQREAICGSKGAAASLDDVVKGLKAGGDWAQAASVNIVDMNTGRMANVERYEGKVGIHEVTAVPSAASNYSHFNRFKEIRGVPEDGSRNSSVHRQEKLDSYPPPQTAADIAERLSDATDKDYPIYRDMTLATFVLDGVSRALQVWCCGRSATSGPPNFIWNLPSFFT